MKRPPAGLWLAAGLLALFLVLRVAFIRADPPPLLPNGFDVYELFAEPVAKAHEARNRALFDAWQTNPADNYHYWRIQSPAWVYPLWAWFEAFGVSYASLRWYSSAIACLGFAAVLAFLGRRDDRTCTAVAGLLLAINFYDVLYQRSGLIEVAVGAWLALLVWSLHRARHDARWLSLSSLALALGFLSKQTMVIAVPMFLLFGLRAYIPWARAHEGKRWQRAVPLVVGLALAAALALYCMQPGYLRTLERNFDHVIHDSLDDARHVTFIEMLHRLFEIRDWRASFFDTMPIVSRLALAQCVRWLFASVFNFVATLRGRQADERIDDGWTTLCVAWLFSACLPFLTAQNELRFRMLVFAPAALLAGAIVADTARSVASAFGAARIRFRTAAHVAVATLAVGAAACFDGPWYVSWIQQRSYEVSSANQTLGRAMGDAPVVVGSWACPLTFETGATCYYVRERFNTTRGQLLQLHITHVLLMDRSDFTGSLLEQVFPRLLRKLEPQVAFDYREREVVLHAVRHPPLR